MLLDENLEVSEFIYEESGDKYEFRWGKIVWTLSFGTFSCWKCYCSFQTENQLHEEFGKLKQIGDSKVFVVEGTYAFKNADGKTFKYENTPDEHGFKVKKIGKRVYL